MNNNKNNWVINRTPELSNQIYNELELPNWAPWLKAAESSILWRSIIFPEWQLLLKDDISNQLIASLSTNRVDRNWNPSSLPSWDEVAWDPTDYSQTYKKNWNTLVLMSMNINPRFQWNWIPSIMINAVKNLASVLDVDNCIWSFRPNGFWLYKLENWDTSFQDYINKKNENWLPIDPWLRNLTRNGMKPIKIDSKAMNVECYIDEMNYYKNTFKPNLWKELVDWNKWICPETWDRYIDWDKATYIESNLWWYLDFKKK